MKIDIFLVTTSVIVFVLSVHLSYRVLFKNQGEVSYEHFKKNLFVFPSNKKHYVIMCKITFPLVSLLIFGFILLQLNVIHF